MPAPTLLLTPLWQTTQSNKTPVSNVKLGDGYTLIMPIGLNTFDETWDIQSPALNQTEMLNYKVFFEQLAGVDPFEWSPTDFWQDATDCAHSPTLATPQTTIARKEYVCSNWQIRAIGRGYYKLSAKFEHFRTVPWPPLGNDGQ